MEKAKRIMLEVEPECVELFELYYDVINRKFGSTKKRILTRLIEAAVRNDALGLGADAPHIPTKEEKRQKKLAEAKKNIQEMNKKRMENGATKFVKLCNENYERYADGKSLIEEEVNN